MTATSDGFEAQVRRVPGTTSWQWRVIHTPYTEGDEVAASSLSNTYALRMAAASAAAHARDRVARQAEDLENTPQWETL